MPAKRKPRKSYQDKCEQLAFRRRAKIYARRFYRIGVVAVLLFAVTFTLWLFNSSKPRSYVQSLADNIVGLTAKTGLRLEHVTFEGNKYTGQEELANELDLTYGKPMLALDLESLRSQIKKKSWVKDAEVHRVLPSNLVITIDERKPIAIWQLGKKYNLIDSDGVVLTEIDSPDILPFPLIIGSGANKEAAHIFATLSHEKHLYQQVQSAALMGERRWNVTFNNGIEVMLPATNMSEAWTKLAEMDQREHILSRQIKSIDLRMPDRIYIKPVEGDVFKTSMRSKSAYNNFPQCPLFYWRGGECNALTTSAMGIYGV